MSQPKLPTSEAISLGWKVAKKEIWLFVGIFLVSGFVSHASKLLKLPKDAPLVMLLIALIVQIGLFVLGVIMHMGTLKIGLKLVEGHKATFSELFSLRQPKRVWNFVLLTLLYLAIVIGGCILLVVPGVIWALKFQYAFTAMVDKNLGPIEALKYSSELTNGVKLQLLDFDFRLILINLLGFLALLIGMFWTAGLSLVASLYLYRHLQKRVS